MKQNYNMPWIGPPTEDAIVATQDAIVANDGFSKFPAILLGKSMSSHYGKRILR